MNKFDDLNKPYKMASRIPKKVPPYLERVFSEIEKAEGLKAGHYSPILAKLEKHWEVVYNKAQSTKEATPKSKKPKTMVAAVKKLLNDYQDIVQSGDKKLIKENQQILQQAFSHLPSHLTSIVQQSIKNGMSSNDVKKILSETKATEKKAKTKSTKTTKKTSKDSVPNRTSKKKESSDEEEEEDEEMKDLSEEEDEEKEEEEEEDDEDAPWDDEEEENEEVLVEVKTKKKK